MGFLSQSIGRTPFLTGKTEGQTTLGHVSSSPRLASRCECYDWILRLVRHGEDEDLRSRPTGERIHPHTIPSIRDRDDGGPMSHCSFFSSHRHPPAVRSHSLARDWESRTSPQSRTESRHNSYATYQRPWFVPALAIISTRLAPHWATDRHRPRRRQVIL